MKIIDLYVVVDNKDPYNASRVRAYPLSLFERTGANATQILKDQDNNAKHKPWKKAENFSEISDPYCFEPFLPKHINLIPKEGDLIKVISYDSDPLLPKEYIIVNSTINNIKNETYRTSDKYHTNNRKRGDLDNTRETVPGYNPSYSDFALTSGKNSDIILNDGRLVLKAGHQTQSDTGVKQINTHQGIFSVTQFPTGYTYLDTEIENIQPARTTINSIIDYQLFDYVNNNVRVNSVNYSFSFLIKIKLLPIQQYTDIVASFVMDTADLEMLMYFNDTKKFITTLKKILGQLEKKQLDYLFDSTQFTVNDDDGITYKIMDKRKPIGGVMPDNSINIGKSFYIRQNKNQELITPEGKDLIDNINNAILASGGYIRPKPQNVKSVKTKKVIRKLTRTNTPETIITSGADKQFFISWQKNDYAALNNREYITQEMIYNKDGLMDTTEPLVRGNQLLVVISKLIDLILSHGHKDVSDSRNTIDNITIEDLNRIKSTILNIKNTEKQLSVEGKDINDAIINLINHNLRIN